MFVCLCNGVTDSQIKDAIESGCKSLKQLKQCTGAMSQCCKCCEHCKELLETTHKHESAVTGS